MAEPLTFLYLPPPMKNIGALAQVMGYNSSWKWKPVADACSPCYWLLTMIGNINQLNTETVDYRAIAALQRW